MRSRLASILLLSWLYAAQVAAAPGLSAATRAVRVEGTQVSVRVVEAAPAQYRLRVALARGRVGCVESLEAIARRTGAAAAINGCFFDAYSGKSLRNPYHTIITGGRMVHRGDVGALLGVWPDGRVHIAGMQTRLVGSLDDRERWPDNWYAYWLNRLPENATAVTIFTPAYGASKTPAGGTQVVVRGGVVCSVGTGSQTIPADGCVVYISGAETPLARRFRVGRRCNWRVCYNATDGSGGWEGVADGLGCFPQLLARGQVTVGLATVTRGKSGEGGNRSAFGVKANGNMLFATTGGLSLYRLACVMRALGCQEALNLDGGASSGLYANGRVLTRPGRALSNALVLVKR